MSDPARPARSSPPMARLAVLVVALIVGLLGTTPAAALATTFPASDYSNVTAFDTCDGTPDTISRSLEALAQGGLSYLGYTSGQYTTTGFTRSLGTGPGQVRFTGDGGFAGGRRRSRRRSPRG